jgi:O-antigen/teichoic acid export membrane protein
MTAPTAATRTETDPGSDSHLLTPVGGTDPDVAPGTDAGGAEDGMRQRLVKGFAWGMGGTAVMQASQIIFGLVLVRLLTPRDYGLASMALVFSTLVLTVSDLSMSNALVQRPHITEADRSTVFWSSLALGSFLALVGVALSGPLAEFYHQPAVQPLFAVVSISFVLVPLQTTQHALLLRDMQFRLMSIRCAVGAVIGGLTGITAALLGAGAWALVVQQIAIALAGTILLWTCTSWRPHFVFSWRSLRDLSGYGLNLVGWQVLSFGRNNADNILIGRFLGSAALGQYGLAFNLMFLPISRLIIPVQDTLFPAFSRWQEDLDRIGRAWLRALQLVTAVLAPALLGIAAVAPDAVDVFFGPKWHAAVPIIQLLALVSLAYCLAQLGHRVFGALDQTGFVFRFALVETPLTIGSFAAGLHWGLVGVAICYAVVSVPLQALYVGFTAKALAVRPATVCRSLSGVALATAVMVTACFLVRLSLVSVHVATPARLFVEIATGIVVYGLSSAIFQPQVVREIRGLRTRRRAAEPLPASA